MSYLLSGFPSLIDYSRFHPGGPQIYAITQILKRDDTSAGAAERNNCIKISTHEKRRERGDLIGIFKFMDSTDLLKKKTTGSSRTNHARSLEVQRCNTNVRKHSFAIRSIHLWNQLPEEVVLSKSLNEFKTKLDTM